MNSYAIILTINKGLGNLVLITDPIITADLATTASPIISIYQVSWSENAEDAPKQAMSTSSLGLATHINQWMLTLCVKLLQKST